MPSKLKKAIGAVKDQTSISLAKVSKTSASNLEVLILKATRHDEAPIDERYVVEVLKLISSNKVYAAACAQAIAKRIGRTRNWIVALKSLMLVLRIFQDGDPYFPREVLHAMKRGAKILNLSNFRDDSSSSPWDYTAFVRTFALYLDERLDCFLTGKLQRRFTNRERKNGPSRSRDSVCDTILKPAVLVDKISHWQRLLDRAVATRPTGAAKTNRLVQMSLYAIVQESFDLYRDISDGLTLLLDSFFIMQYQSCASAFQACIKASKQFGELCAFYDLCKSIGVGRTSEYPSVQKISEELIETLQEFLKDQASFPANGRSPTHPLLIGPPIKDPSTSSDRYDAYSQWSEPKAERFSMERGSEFGSQCTSLEDLMSVTDVPASPAMSMDRYLEQFEGQSQADDVTSAADSGSNCGSLSARNSAIDMVSLDDWPPEDPKQQEDQKSEKDQGQQTSAFELSTKQGTISARSSTIDLVSLDDWPIEDLKQGDQNQEKEQGRQISSLDLSRSASHGWEIVLAEAATQSSANEYSSGFDTSTFDNMFDEDSSTLANGFEPPATTNLFDQATVLEHQYNPFLQDTLELAIVSTTTANEQAAFPVDDMFSAAPTFQATPTFSAHIPEPTFQATASPRFSSKTPEPTFQAAPSPTFSIEAPEPTFSSQNPEPTFLATPTFGAQNPEPTFRASPMFSTQSPEPTFQAATTFSAQNPGGAMVAWQEENDPFGPWPTIGAANCGQGSGGYVDQQSLSHLQQLWLQQQEKILAKNMS